jgi:predicted nucleic acid-binding protein
MAVKIFLDANVLLDLTLKREFYEDSKELLALIINNQIKAFTTSSVIHIVAHWTSKYRGPVMTKEILISLLSDITLVDISHDTALIALHSKINDIEDALQYYTAIQHKLDYFISRDKQLQKDSIPLLPVFSIKDFLKAIS